MTKIHKYIEIARSNVSSLSSMSSVSCDAVYRMLKRHYTQVGISIINTEADLRALVDKRPDLVFVGVKYVPSDPNFKFMHAEKTWVTEYLGDNGIAFTGSDSAAHKLELDKHLAKQRVLDAGLSTSAYVLVEQNVPLGILAEGLRYPVFIKPTNKGGGLGIDSDSVAYDIKGLQSKVDMLTDRFHTDALVEKYLTGREFSVAVLKELDSGEYSVMPLELIAPKDSRGARILSSAVKSADTETFLDVHETCLKTELSKLALDVFHALGASDYGRIDIRLDEIGIPHFLEANLIPSIIEGYGNFPKACMLNKGKGYKDMLLHIVSLGFNKQQPIDELQEIGTLSGVLVPLPA